MVKSQALLLMLEKAIKRYQNNLLTTSEIITEMINIARNVRESDQRGEQLNLTEDEIAFYDALEVNDSAVRIWGNEKLRDIAEKVKKTPQLIGRCATVPAATLMVIVRRTLNKHGTHPTNRKKQHNWCCARRRCWRIFGPPAPSLLDPPHRVQPLLLVP